jgi:hypothetical protein
MDIKKQLLSHYNIVVKKDNKRNRQKELTHSQLIYANKMEKIKHLFNNKHLVSFGWGCNSKLYSWLYQKQPYLPFDWGGNSTYAVLKVLENGEKKTNSIMINPYNWFYARGIKNNIDHKPGSWYLTNKILYFYIRHDYGILKPELSQEQANQQLINLKEKRAFKNMKSKYFRRIRRFFNIIKNPGNIYIYVEHNFQPWGVHTEKDFPEESKKIFPEKYDNSYNEKQHIMEKNNMNTISNLLKKHNSDFKILYFSHYLKQDFLVQNNVIYLKMDHINNKLFYDTDWGDQNKFYTDTLLKNHVNLKKYI